MGYIRKAKLPFEYIGNARDNLELKKSHYTNMATLYQNHGFCLSFNNYLQGIDSYTSNRLFNICGSGGLAIVKRFPNIEEFYQPEVDVVTFGDFDEFMNKYEFYAENPDLCEKIRLNSWLRTMQAHTYTHRLLEMLRIINHYV